MKKLQRLTYIIIFTIIILLGNNVQAKEFAPIFNVNYENYSKLEDKRNYIQPVPFIINYETNTNTAKTSNNAMYAKLRTAYQSKYMLNGLEVKNQQDTNQCWAFSTTSVLESNLLKLTSKTDRYSPRHMDYYTSKTFLNNKINLKGYNREVGNGGNFYMGLGYYTSGAGPILENDMPFENNENKIDISKIQNKTPQKSIKDYTLFPNIYKEYNGNVVTYTNGVAKGDANRKEYTKQQVQEIRDLVKTHIVTYGAVSALTYSGTEESMGYYNLDKLKNGQSQYFSYYCDKQNALADHAITIVGWDDDFSVDNFNDAHKPASNGAWIILNSYGEEAFNKGYMYISYDDVLVETALAGICETTNIDYDNIYQHDELGYNYGFVPTNNITGETLSTIYAANVFKKENTEKENLTQISFFVPQATNISIYANLAGSDLENKKLIENLGTMDVGYHTYELKVPQKITGSEFAIIVQYNADVVAIPLEFNYYSNTNGQHSNFWDTATSQAGQSYVSVNGTDWQDLTTILKDSNPCIKAFTVNEKEADIKVTNLTLEPTQKELKIGEMATLTAVVSPENATNKTISWTTENKDIATVNAGVVTAIGEGTTNIKATTKDGNITKTCKITVTKKAENKPIEVTSIRLSQNNKTIKIGEQFTINATVLPENATNKEIEWTSTDNKIATVDNNGNVKGITEGKVTITATNKANNISESCIVIVSSNSKPTPVPPPEEKEPIKIDPITPSGSTNNGQNSEKGDNTTSNNLPKTGISATIVLLIIIVTAIGTYSFIRYKKSQIKYV